jgi:WhiB family redox-sensing transcriptional regulator
MVDPDTLFDQGTAQSAAKTLCLGCAVQVECLAHALDHRVEYGVWGGQTEAERRRLLQRRPTVTSWWRVLDAARTEHARRTGSHDRTTQHTTRGGGAR